VTTRAYPVGGPLAVGELRRAGGALPVIHDDYVAFCDGVRALCDIDLLQYKRGQMERRVRAFAERRGHAGLETYLEVLTGDAAARDEFLDRVTINVSNLWRNPEQWARLEAEIVPDLAADGTLRAWSAGCSYGAEAYTLAAVCRLAAPTARTSIIGTDIDRRAIERAREGSFSADDVRDAPPNALARFFAMDGERWRPTSELRALVGFELGDLLRLRPPTGVYDLVLCRNTVIYFNEEVRDALHERLATALRPGGVLVVGATERVNAPEAIGLQATAPFTYRKAA
jgi:chemotaxis protein methyltransferase CheR